MVGIDEITKHINFNEESPFELFNSSCLNLKFVITRMYENLSKTSFDYLENLDKSTLNFNQQLVVKKHLYDALDANEFFWNTMANSTLPLRSAIADIMDFHSLSQMINLIDINSYRHRYEHILVDVSFPYKNGLIMFSDSYIKKPYEERIITKYRLETKIYDDLYVWPETINKFTCELMNVIHNINKTLNMYKDFIYNKPINELSPSMRKFKEEMENETNETQMLKSRYSLNNSELYVIEICDIISCISIHHTVFEQKITNLIKKLVDPNFNKDKILIRDF